MTIIIFRVNTRERKIHSFRKYETHKSVNEFEKKHENYENKRKNAFNSKLARVVRISIRNAKRRNAKGQRRKQNRQ